MIFNGTNKRSHFTQKKHHEAKSELQRDANPDLQAA